jgi:signal transduction histidine kinase
MVLLAQAKEISLELILVLVLGVVLAMSIGIVLFFYFSRKKVIKAQLEKAELEIQHQKDLLQSTLLTQEEERQRIAQDLHDAISSKLNVVSLQASQLTEPGRDEELQQLGEQLLKMTGLVLENSRRIAHDLLPPTLSKFGLVAALEELCEEIEESGNWEVCHDLEMEEGGLQSDQELQLFRMVQELTNNSLKHSGGNKIELRLGLEQNLLSLVYKDNGKGFDMATIGQKRTGLGLSGLENRAQILKADMHLDSAPGSGIHFELNMRL